MANNGLKVTIIPPPEIEPMSEPQDIEERLGISFINKKLLLQALTHRSYINENRDLVHEVGDNERLEFLGDAILEFVVGDWLYQQYTDLREGRLTRMRSALVRTEMLAEFAVMCCLNAALRLGRGEESNGGRTRISNLCGTFEAVIGAIYLDQGVEAVREFFYPFYEIGLTKILREVSLKDAKSRLQEWSQSQPGHATPRYLLLSALGPDHQKNFTVEVAVGNVPLGWGTGSSKRRAEQAAALMALETLDVVDKLTD